MMGSEVSPNTTAGEPSNVFSSSSGFCSFMRMVSFVGCVTNNSLMNATSIPSREEPVSTRNVASLFPTRMEMVIPWSMQCVRGIFGSF